MGEHYGALLKLEDVPADWAIDRTRPWGWSWVQLNINAIEDSDQALFGAIVLAGLSETEDCHLSVEERENGRINIDLVLGDASYGITQFIDAGLDRALKGAGIAFYMDDDGKYEIPGQCRYWRPGLDEIQERTHVASAGICLTAGDLRDLWDEDPAIFAQRVLDHLDVGRDELQARVSA